MKRENARELLLEYLSGLEIVDTHEHFATEDQHIETEFSFFHWLIPYLQFDLRSAGMSGDFLWKTPVGPEEEDRFWKAVAPCWPSVRHGSYARPMRMALKAFYGVEDLTDANYREIGEQMRATRYAGRYREILMERCKIKYMLNQAGKAGYPNAWMKGCFQVVNKIHQADLKQFFEKQPHGSMEDYLASIVDEMMTAVANGAVLAKYDASSFLTLPDREKAREEFLAIQSGKAELRHGGVLACWLYEQTLEVVRETGIVAAVHTGVWGDINQKTPLLLFPVVERHPEVVFDIYHMGMPFVRECGFLGKNHGNAYLNLCWSHIVSERMTVSALDEWLDYIPTNKVFGFGGDFVTMPENIWAHLQIARENLAEVFSNRISREHMDLDDAKQILKGWMHDNPIRVYRLE